MSADPHDRQEIIIVKRHGDHEEAHHGGVWKIAFADFMTAMMAFFLVMWLTNSSDDATKKQIAQYFNPIKLNDSTPSARGLNDGNSGASLPIPDRDQGKVKTDGVPGGKPIAGPESGGEQEAVFTDPYAVLAEIAAEGGPGIDDERKQPGVPDGSGLPGLNGGEAYRDPFDPTSWQLAPNAVESGGKIDNSAPPEFKTTVQKIVDGSGDKPDRGDGTTADAGKGDGKTPDAGKGEGKSADAGKGDGKSAEKAMSDAEKLKQEIDQKIASLAPNLPSQVQVKAGDGGVSISLADNLTSGMFQIGSSKPTKEAIEMMQRIAGVLAERTGEITIRGHTDARPYRGEEYDNWQLSTARAHMAFYMLVRGGLDETRVKAIEGMADRDPLDKSDPEAAANRRIEIFLTEPKA
ncbi:MotB family protein [Mangrovibrevibacter kandeliae]|uniref:MotB family protein n=1 Tax=Mangrovibrevibacter kandeliae TaxID=2968473 RepID=UPI0021187099|nr:MotB family protein [Aurantimonas sp. CSK15Z-1]